MRPTTSPLDEARGYSAGPLTSQARNAPFFAYFRNSVNNADRLRRTRQAAFSPDRPFCKPAAAQIASFEGPSAGRAGAHPCGCRRNRAAPLRLFLSRRAPACSSAAGALRPASPGRGPWRRDLAQPFHHRAGAGRDQTADDHVLLQALQAVDLAVDRRLGEDAGGLLERRRGDEGLGLQRSPW